MDWKTDLDEILPGLYLGSSTPGLHQDVLNQHEIVSILIAAGEVQPQFPDDFKYLQLEIEDQTDQDILECLNECLTFID